MNPKPLPFILSKPKQRLPERKRMTLIGALTGDHCGVLFADSQETIQGYSKKDVGKIAVWGHGNFNFAIGGASDSGPYLDMFNREIENALDIDFIETNATAILIDEVIRKRIEDVSHAFHQRHVWPQKDGPMLETLVMVQNGRLCEIIHIAGTAVNPLLTATRKSIGIGSPLADYLMDKLMAGGGSEEELFATSVYVLQQAKLNVDGVGLASHIALFSSDGNVSGFGQTDVEPL